MSCPMEWNQLDDYFYMKYATLITIYSSDSQEYVDTLFSIITIHHTLSDIQMTNSGASVDHLQIPIHFEETWLNTHVWIFRFFLSSW